MSASELTESIWAVVCVMGIVALAAIVMFWVREYNK